MTTNIDITLLSKFILLYCNKNGIGINHFKLQKLLYYTQAWHLVYFEVSIFEEEPEAWVNGPVYRTIYNEHKHLYANTPLKADGDLDVLIKENLDVLSLDKEQITFLSSLLNHYGLMPHEKLIVLTHKEKPWNEARAGLGEFDSSTNKISLKSMYDFYSQYRKTS